MLRQAKGLPCQSLEAVAPDCACVLLAYGDAQTRTGTVVGRDVKPY